MSKKNKRVYPVEVEEVANAINKEVAKINYYIKVAKDVILKYTKEQMALRDVVRNENNGLVDYQLNKVKNDIQIHRIILRGVHTYMRDLKIRKEKLQKSHPKNMKKAQKTEK